VVLNMPDATPGIDAAPAAPETACHFTSAQHAEELLRRQGYIADGRIAGVVHLAGRLAKPVLVEGPAGTGKTQLAKSVAQACGLRLILVRSLRSLDLKKKPSISETLDWVRTLGAAQRLRRRRPAPYRNHAGAAEERCRHRDRAQGIR
jgi:hypothetical protein